MSTFEQSRGLFNQTHFTIVEIDVPVIEGVCTVSGEPGFGTPLSCDQPSNATRTYKFTQENAPLLDESDIYRQITNISETPAKLNTGKGLASRGTGSIKLRDFTGKDPNTDAPAVNQDVINQGSFISKLDARNILANREVRIKNYRVEVDGSIDLENGAEIRYYIIDSVSYNGKSMWTINFKDELSKINTGESVWPLPLEGFLREDLDATEALINIDPNVDYKVGDSIRIGEEFMKINAISDIQGANPQITVDIRGQPIDYTETLTRTVNTDHSSGDEVYVCEISDNERIDDLLERILLDIGIEQRFIPKSDWAAEIDEWHPLTRINTLWYESQDTAEVLESILTNFLIDMWFDPVARQIKLSAISVWKDSSQMLFEGDQINYDSVKKKKEENLRVTRSLVVYDKRYLATSDDVENYNRASLFTRSELETGDLFGEPKTKRFEFSRILSKDSADLLTQRWTSRYINPSSYTFKVPERKLTFNTGDVVDAVLFDEVGFDGLPSSASRFQIMSIKPNYTKEGRDYSVSALSYEPVFTSGSEIVVSGNTFDVNLYIQYAGAPSQPVELTFIFDGTISGSTSNIIPSIKSGAFPAGSKLIIILANGAELMAKGGDGGNGGGAEFDQESDSWFTIPHPANGEDGGTVFDAEGIDIDIYFSGATPSSNYPNADGYIIAPSGGDGGFSADTKEPIGGDGGNGGNGRVSGFGGTAGSAIINNQQNNASNGANGTDNRLAGGFGVSGANNNATGGLAGKGVVDNGGTVNFFGDTTQRYVNGIGDH